MSVFKAKIIFSAHHRLFKSQRMNKFTKYSSNPKEKNLSTNLVLLKSKVKNLYSKLYNSEGWDDLDHGNKPNLTWVAGRLIFQSLAS